MLMENLRNEILGLLLEGVQRSASYCASLCAERIIAARRQVLRQRTDAENVFPQRQQTSRKASERKAKAGAAPKAPRAPLGRVVTPSPPKRAAARPKAASPAGEAEAPLRSPRLPGGIWTQTPRISPRRPRSEQSRDSLLESWIVSAEGSQDEFPAPPVSTPSPSYDAVFIDTYDAVSALEERTALAMEAMDRLDDVLNTPLSSSRERSVSPPSAARGGERGGETPSFGRVVKQFPGLPDPRGGPVASPVSSPIKPAPFGLASRTISMMSRPGDLQAPGRPSVSTPASMRTGLR